MENQKKSEDTRGDYTHTKPLSFTFEHRLESRTWKCLLLEVCSILYNRHKDVFLQKVLDHYIASNRMYFSTDRDDADRGIIGTMVAGRHIPNIDIDIWVETSWNANDTDKLCRELIELFGDSNDGFNINLVP